MEATVLMKKIEQLEQKIELLETAENSRWSRKILQYIRKRYFLPFLGLGITLVSSIVIAATIPNSFTTGSVISASEFNANFTYIKDRLWELTGSDLYYTAGNVGIGTTSPQKKLQIGEGNQASDPAIDGIIRVGTSNGTNGFREWDFGTSRISGLEDKFFIQDVQMSSPALVIAPSTGNVGIGTTNPGNATLMVRKSVTGNVPDVNTVALFEMTGDPSVNIAGTSSAALKLFTGNRYDGGIAVDAGTRNLYFFAGGGAVYSTLTSTGNVGIGTTSPSSKLAVVGLPSGTSASNAGASGSAAGAVCITSSGNMYIDTDGSCD